MREVDFRFSLLLVCPCDVIMLWGLLLMLQELGVPEDLGSVVLLHDEGPVGAVLVGSLLPDGALDVPTFGEDILHDASVPNLEAIWAGASLLEGDLSLLVPSVGDELVMVHKSLDGIWQEGPGGSSKKAFCCSANISILWVVVYVKSEFVHDFLCYSFNPISFQAVF